MWEIDCVEAMEGDKKTHKKENRGSRTSETKLGKKLRKPGGEKERMDGDERERRREEEEVERRFSLV